jgi:hypothetical protein
MRHGVVLVFVTALAALLAACGGGGGTDTTLSAAEFRQQADAICAKYQDQLNALGTPSSLAGLKDYVNKAVPIIEKGNAELQALEPPEELAGTWNRAMELNQQQLDIVRDLQQAVESEDQAKMQDLLQQADAANAESDKLAQQLGLQECGKETAGG